MKTSKLLPHFTLNRCKLHATFFLMGKKSTARAPFSNLRFHFPPCRFGQQRHKLINFVQITYVEELRTKAADSPSVSGNSDLPDEPSRPAQTVYPPQPSFPLDAQIYRQSAYHIAPNYGIKDPTGYSIPTTPDPAVINQMLQNPYFLQTALPSHLMLNKANEKLFLDPTQQANPAGQNTRSQQNSGTQQPAWQVPQQTGLANTYQVQYANTASQNVNSNSPARTQNNNANGANNVNGNGNNGQYDNPQGVVEYSRFLMVRTVL